MIPQPRSRAGIDSTTEGDALLAGNFDRAAIAAPRAASCQHLSRESGAAIGPDHDATTRAVLAGARIEHGGGIDRGPARGGDAGRRALESTTDQYLAPEMDAGCADRRISQHDLVTQHAYLAPLFAIGMQVTRQENLARPIVTTGPQGDASSRAIAANGVHRTGIGLDQVAIGGNLHRSAPITRSIDITGKQHIIRGHPDGAASGREAPRVADEMGAFKNDAAIEFMRTVCANHAFVVDHGLSQTIGGASGQQHLSAIGLDRMPVFYPAVQRGFLDLETNQIVPRQI